MLSRNSRKPPHVEVVCVGTELLSGQVNTHTAYIAEKLASLGLFIAREQAVVDDLKEMVAAFGEAYHRSRVVICAGGLGPTFDDITREAWSKVVKRPLRFQSWIVDDIREKFRSRGIKMPAMNRRQAYVLKGAEAISNHNGTAPGQFFDSGGKILILLPGPSRELYPMMEDAILPRLREIFPGLHSAQKFFHLVGIPESKVDEIIRPLIARTATVAGCRVTHGILASQSIITVKFRLEGTGAGQVQNAAHHLATQIRKRLGPAVFGEDVDTLPGVIGKLLMRHDKTLAVAESCTGGLVSKLITDQAGSSNYFVEGVTTYANRSKVARLGVRQKTLDKYGAVSARTAKEMAEGLRKKARVDYTLSVTGIAGPDGGTAEKPVGLVYIACAGPKRTVVRDFHFTGDRPWIRHRAALVALDILRRELLA